jgi:hypothetical protein
VTDTVSAGAGGAGPGRRDALAERLLQSLIGSMELASIWAGLRLDLYEVLRRHGPVTVDELAELAGIDARYAREWLEQQAVAGLLDVEDAGQDAAELGAAGEGGYDAAFIFEALHDMARPVEALVAIRALPASRAETPSVAAGTALRADTVRQWADQAGFSNLQVLPVDHLFWRFYELSG